MDRHILIDKQDLIDLINELNVDGEINTAELLVSLTSLKHFLSTKNGEIKPIISMSELRRVEIQMKD